MTPQLETDKPVQYSHRTYPDYRSGRLSPHDWLVGRQKDDNAEGLWRIHDELYDLSEWLHKHPGGSDWLIQTKGTDITEAFECSHLSTLPASILHKYHKRHVDTPRNSTFTFKDDGFYRTLKRRVAEEVKTIPKDYAMRSKFSLDMLIFFTFFFSIVAVNTPYWTVMVLSVLSASLCLAWMTNAAHNFFHQKDNWRMYAFNISLLTVRDWRVSHVLSHHTYTNTLNDLEVSSFEPFLQWLPLKKGPFRHIWFLAAPTAYALIFFGQFVINVIYLARTRQFFVQTLIPLILPSLMLLFGTASILLTLLTWLFILGIGSFIFGFIGVNAAHHHPKIFHDGDALREDRDWGKFQLDAVMDRYIITGSRFLCLTHYGDHALHHLFPTVDHSILPFLYPIVNEVCAEFGVKLRFITITEMIVGQFKQLTSTTANPHPPNCSLD